MRPELKKFTEEKTSLPAVAAVYLASLLPVVLIVNPIFDRLPIITLDTTQTPQIGIFLNQILPIFKIGQESLKVS
jgi:hypothetical protein